MRTIEIRLGDDEEIIRLYATLGRRHYLAVIESEDGRFRFAERNAGRVFARGATRTFVYESVENMIRGAKIMDGITYTPIETSCAL